MYIQNLLKLQVYTIMGEGIMYVLKIILAVFALIGAVDRVTGEKLKLGDEFEKGIMSTGPLALAMVGMITVAPAISAILAPVLTPFANFLHIDLSFIAGFVANDMGGAAIANELNTSQQWGGFNGLVVAAMMGVTVCFTIPIALNTIDVKYHKDVLNGILCGISTIPVGCIISGLYMGYDFFALIMNLLPVIFVSLITCVGLLLNPALCRKIFDVIGKCILILITLGLAVGIFTHITGFVIISNLAPVIDGFATVCDIAIILAGIFPLIAVISRIFGGLFTKIGKIININDASVLGLIASLANSLPMFDLIDKMNPKGRIMNMAFAVSASFVFGDHLAFTMAYDEKYVAGMVIGKLVGGVSALVVAHILYTCTYKKINNNIIG